MVDIDAVELLTDGTVVDLERDGGGIDWRGAFIGSEGTFGITTRATVRLVPRPPSVRTFLVSYSSLEASCEAVAAIIAAMACVFGGILEWVAQNYLPSEVPWGLRMLWHAACAFGASYCMFLQRLLRVLPA